MTKSPKATSSSKQQAQKQAKNKPAKSQSKTKERRASWRVIAMLWPYFWRDTDKQKRLQLIAALACLVGAKLVTVTAPAIYREIIDSLNLEGIEDASLAVTIPLGLIVAYAFARLGSVVFQELRELAYVPISRRIVRLVCTKVFAHLHSLSLNFHLSRRTGSVIRIMERGQLGIVIFLQFLVLAAAPNLIEVIAVGIILGLVFGPEYAVLVVVIIASYTWFTLAVNEWRMKFRREMNNQENLANARAVDSLINAEVVQSFGNEQFEVNRYDQALKKYEQATIVSTRSLSALNLGQAVIVGIGQAMLMLLAARQYSLDEITLGAFVMINTYLLQLYAPLNFLGTLMRNLRTAMTDLEDLLDLLKNKDQLLDQKNAVQRKAIPGKIDFDKVQFSYLEGPAVLKGVSFSVKRNSKVAVVGVSGSGKSTITRLLLRFQNPTGGEILIDDKPLGEYTIASLRACTAIVPQDIVLFNESIAFNIAYGQVTADKKAIIKAAKSAALHDFIMTLPKGYDTAVGERGLKLSGGQRQRVAIARALIKNPAFLILDEATASLDTATERQIQKTLYKISSGRTTLMIAHRLSTVVDCDKIIVLEKGEIIESGEHQELMNKKGAYAKMWQAQQKEKTAGALLPATKISL